MTGREFIIDLIVIEEAGDDREFRKQRVEKFANAFEKFWAGVLLTNDRHGRGKRPAEEIVESACGQWPDLFDELCDRQIASKPWVRRGVAVMLREKQAWEVSIPAIFTTLQDHFAVHPGGLKPRPQDWDIDQLVARTVERGLIRAELMPPAQGTPEQGANFRKLEVRMEQLTRQVGGLGWKFYCENQPGSCAEMYDSLRLLVIEGKLDDIIRPDEMYCLRTILYARDLRREHNFELESRGELVRDTTEDGFLFWRIII